jgi:hypothetical protein
MLARRTLLWAANIEETSERIIRRARDHIEPEIRKRERRPPALPEENNPVVLLIETTRDHVEAATGEKD